MAKGRATSSERPADNINKIDARPRLDSASGGGVSTLSALAQATVPAWVQTAVMVSLIFGGCCSNVSFRSLALALCARDAEERVKKEGEDKKRIE